MKNKILISLIVLTLFGCKSKYEYWDIDKFNLIEDALKDGEEIKLIYTSQSPDYNKDLEYYIHVIVVSQLSGDTVNILTTANNGFKKGDEKKVYNFLNSDNIATKIAQTDLKNLESTNFNETELKDIKKVLRDPEFDYIADNNFPTIIGVIGKTEVSK